MTAAGWLRSNTSKIAKQARLLSVSERIMAFCAGGYWVAGGKPWVASSSYWWVCET
jgi:hypothetical protein